MWGRHQGTSRHLEPWLLGAPVALLLIATACGSPIDPSATSACPVGYVSKGSMSFKIDGVPWISKCVTHADYIAGASIYVFGLDDSLDSGRAQGMALWT